MDNRELLLQAIKVIYSLLKVINSHVPEDAQIIDCKCKDKIESAREFIHTTLKTINS